MPTPKPEHPKFTTFATPEDQAEAFQRYEQDLAHWRHVNRHGNSYEERDGRRPDVAAPVDREER